MGIQITGLSSPLFARRYRGDPGWFLLLRLMICLSSAGDVTRPEVGRCEGTLFIIHIKKKFSREKSPDFYLTLNKKGFSCFFLFLVLRQKLTLKRRLLNRCEESRPICLQTGGC
jgi:hypothetical protein